jgi:hypothetical protein
VSRVRENLTHGSMGGGRKPTPVGQGRAAPGASRLPDRPREQARELLGEAIKRLERANNLPWSSKWGDAEEPGGRGEGE